MRIGKTKNPSKYKCDKCGIELNFRSGGGGFKHIHKYYKAGLSSIPYKDFDLCTNCEKKFREWLKEKPIPTTEEMIARFPIYKV